MDFSSEKRSSYSHRWWHLASAGHPKHDWNTAASYWCASAIQYIHPAPPVKQCLWYLKHSQLTMLKNRSLSYQNLALSLAWISWSSSFNMPSEPNSPETPQATSFGFAGIFCSSSCLPLHHHLSNQSPRRVSPVWNCRPVQVNIRTFPPRASLHKKTLAWQQPPWRIGATIDGRNPAIISWDLQNIVHHGSRISDINSI